MSQQRTKKYYDLVGSISPVPDRPSLLSSGRLVVALFEFRALPEIEHVLNAVSQVYPSPNSIGLSIVYGTQNQEYVEKRWGDWPGIILVNTGDFNHDARSYSARLETPELWENFKAFDHVLLIQCDALLLRPIPESYFKYDYIGAPWSNPEFRGLAGNGGFSLRRVSAMVRACERNRGLKLDQVRLEHGYEDGFFCRQPSFTYPSPTERDHHLAFCIESIYHPDPIGLHKVYHWISNYAEWEAILANIRAKFKLSG